MKKKGSSFTLFYKFNVAILLYTVVIATTTFLLLNYGYRKVITKELKNFTKFVNHIMTKSFVGDTKNVLQTIDEFVINYKDESSVRKSQQLKNIISVSNSNWFPSYIKVVDYVNQAGEVLYSSDERRIGSQVNLKGLKTENFANKSQIIALHKNLIEMGNRNYIPMVYKINARGEEITFGTGYVVLYLDILEHIKQLRKNIFMLLERSLLGTGNQHKSHHYFKIYAINNRGEVFGEQNEDTFEHIKLSINNLFQDNPDITNQLLNSISRRQNSIITNHDNNIISLVRLTTSSWYLAIQMNYDNIFSNELHNIK